jgi:serine/threonine protein kinase/WD40 repeat protein
MEDSSGEGLTDPGTNDSGSYVPNSGDEFPFEAAFPFIPNDQDPVAPNDPDTTPLIPEDLDPESLMESLDRFLEKCRSIEDNPERLLDDATFVDRMLSEEDRCAEDLDELQESLQILFDYNAVADERPESDPNQEESLDSVFDSIHSDSPLFVNGRFVIRHPIGRGSYGIVYRAFDMVTQREVAVKMPRPELRGIRTVEKRFDREGKSIGKVTHPGLVPLLDMGVDAGTPYLVTRLVNGPNLESWLDSASGKLPLELASRWGEQLAEAVDHLHKKKIVHGDIKPSNILLEHPYEEELLEIQPQLLAIRVTDFGNASITSGGSPGRSERVQGTLCFMAPEQLSPTYRTDEKSDIYSICAVIYEMISGREVFENTGSRGLEAAIRSSHPVSLRKLRPETPFALQAIVMKGLSKNPADRYETAGELARDLNAWRNLRTPEVLRNHHLRKSALWLRRNRTVASILTISILVISAVALARFYETRIQQRLELARERMAWWSNYVDEIEVAKRYLARNSPKQVRMVLNNLSQWPAHLRRNDDPREFAWHYLETQSRDRSRVIHGFPPDVIHLSLLLDPTEQHFYAGGSDGFIREIDIDSETVIKATNIQDKAIQTLAISPDGRLIAASDPTGSILILDAGSMNIRASVRDHNDEVTGLAFTPDSRRLVSCSIQGILSIFDIEERKSKISKADVALSDDPQIAFLGLTLLDDGARIAVAVSNNSIRIFDSNTGASVGKLDGHYGAVHQLATSGDRKWLISTGNDLTLAFWDLASMKQINQVSVGTEFSYVKPRIGEHTKLRKVRSLTVIEDIDGSCMTAVDSGEGHVKFFEVPTGNEMSELTGEYGHVLSMAWSRYRRKLFGASGDGVVRVWDGPFIEQSLRSDSFELYRRPDGTEVACFLDVYKNDNATWQGNQPVLSVYYDSSNYRIDRTASANEGRLWGAISKRFDPSIEAMKIEFRFAHASEAQLPNRQEANWILAEEHIVKRRRSAPTLQGASFQAVFPGSRQ